MRKRRVGSRRVLLQGAADPHEALRGGFRGDGPIKVGASSV